MDALEVSNLRPLSSKSWYSRKLSTPVHVSCQFSVAVPATCPFIEMLLALRNYAMNVDHIGDLRFSKDLSLGLPVSNLLSKSTGDKKHKQIKS